MLLCRTDTRARVRRRSVECLLTAVSAECDGRDADFGDVHFPVAVHARLSVSGGAAHHSHLALLTRLFVSLHRHRHDRLTTVDAR